MIVTSIPTQTRPDSTVVSADSGTPVTLIPIPIFGSAVVKSSAGVTLTAGIDYTISYLSGVITVTSATPIEIKIDWEWDATAEVIQEGIDWLSMQVGKPTATINVTVIDGVATLPPDALIITAVSRCGCVVEACGCGAACFDWQYVIRPTFESSQEGDHKICYIKRLATAEAPQEWLPCLAHWLADRAVQSSGGLDLIKEAYQYGDEKVELGYSRNSSATPASAALDRCVNALKHGRQFGMRANWGLPCR